MGTRREVDRPGTLPAAGTRLCHAWQSKVHSDPCFVVSKQGINARGVGVGLAPIAGSAGQAHGLPGRFRRLDGPLGP